MLPAVPAPDEVHGGAGCDDDRGAPRGLRPADGRAALGAGSHTRGRRAGTAPGAGTLRPFGPRLPLAPTPPGGYQEPRFLHVYSARPDRVFAILLTHEGYRTFGGDGTRWNQLPPQGAAGNRPHMSDDGELIILDVFDKVDGEYKSMTRVMTWDGQIIEQWPYQERDTFGFVEHGQRWITQTRDDERKFVHAAGAEPRPYAGEKWFDPHAGGTS